MADQDSRHSRTFRVFVSSTFSDLKAERDALARFVFPRLRELCAERGARFQAIDLRWGVSEEAGLDQRTSRMMKFGRGVTRWQRSISPRQMGIVATGTAGGPLPPQISAAEFAEIEAHVAASDDRALLATWYRLDENAVPPDWCLQPRHVALVEGADPKAQQAAADAEAAA
jgi:NACHT domain- and WD repeat-containing protein